MESDPKHVRLTSCGSGFNCEQTKVHYCQFVIFIIPITITTPGIDSAPSSPIGFGVYTFYIFINCPFKWQQIASWDKKQAATRNHRPRTSSSRVLNSVTHPEFFTIYLYMREGGREGGKNNASLAWRPGVGKNSSCCVVWLTYLTLQCFVLNNLFN